MKRRKSAVICNAIAAESVTFKQVNGENNIEIMAATKQLALPSRIIDGAKIFLAPYHIRV